MNKAENKRRDARFFLEGNMEKYTRWDDFLVAEHELIERGMAVLKGCLDDFAGSLREPFRLQRGLDFLLEFGDKIHNRKEEDFLFPLMGSRGIPVEGGPLGVMVREHGEERQLLQSMLGRLPGLASAPDVDKERFQQEGLDYLRIRAEHIWKENDVLYPMGRKVMINSDNEYLLEQFDLLDRQYYGPQAKSSYIAMLEEAEAGAGVHKRLIDSLSYEQLDALMEALPFEVTFVDVDDTVAYFNRLDKTKIFPRTRSVIGRKVEKCHPEKSVDNVRRIVEGFKKGTMDKAEFWIDFKGDKILIRYFPVRDRAGNYLGVVEVTEEIGRIQKLEGQKRLLD
jgi:uncharacterized protein